MLTARKLGFMAILLISVALYFSYRSVETVRVRCRLLALKTEGSIPWISWRDVWWRMLPAGARLPERPVGPIRETQHGEEPCPVLWDTPAGPFWGRASDGGQLGLLLEEQLVRHIYESGEVRVRPGDVVLDAGSHLGTFTRAALQQGAAAVIGFEPDPVTATCFKRTFQAEMASGKVTLVESALWDSSGWLELTDVSDASATSSVLPTSYPGHRMRVPSTTIDETVGRLKLNRVDFIKMDIEGAEPWAIRGGTRTIQMFGPRMALCIYHKPDHVLTVPKEVLTIRPGYRVTSRYVSQAFFY